MPELTITCPECKKEIKLTESLAAPLVESTRRDYPNLKDGEQIFIQPTGAIEEAYPAPWKKTVPEIEAMTPTDKTELGKTVGDAISKPEFEANLSAGFAALSKAWEKAHK